MASMTPEQLKKAQNNKEGASIFYPLMAFLFIAFGLLLILKLLNIQYALLNDSFIKYIPEKVMLGISGVGSTFGGLYMLYRKYIYRQRLIVR